MLVTFLVASIIYTVNHFVKAHREEQEFKILEEIISIDNSNNDGDALSDVDENNQSENENDENGQIDNKNSKTINFKLSQN